MKTHDVCFPQETHLSIRSLHALRKFAQRAGCFVFGYAGSQQSGGVAVLVRQAFLEDNFSHCTWEELVPGRLGVLRCSGERGCASFFNAHFFPTTDEARRDAIDTFRRHIRMDECVVAAGDFNFVTSLDDRLNYSLDADVRDNDRTIRAYWDEHCWDLSEVSQTTSMTYFGFDHTARLDRIYITSSLIPPQLYRIQSSILAGYRNLSDHVPVSVGIALKTTKSSNRISNASIMDPLFKTYVEQL